MVLLAAPALVYAQVEPIDLVNQVDLDNYRHNLDDLLYAHDGDNRGVNGPEHDLARNNIEATFTSLGLDTYLHPFDYRGKTYYNVVGVMEGQVTPDQQYIIGAHYDSVDNPGADDNGSGVAGMMEMARIFTQYDFEATIIFISFDREEQGLWGSKAYASEHRDDDIRGMISADMIAYTAGGGTCKIYGRTASNSIKYPLADAVERYSNGLIPEIKGTFDASDHAPFEWEGKPACLFIEGDWTINPCYHRQCDSVDTPDYIDYDFAWQMVRSATGYLAEAAGLISDTRCADMKKFAARCRGRGKIVAKAKMRNTNHNGQTVTFGIDNIEHFDVVIKGKKAKLRKCCYNGPHTVSIVDPANCVDPVEVGCPD